mgnify:CR=1 FL=1
MQLDIDKKTLGENFRKFRKLKNLTQFQLAEKVGLNEKQISRIEAGQNYPTYATFVKLIKILEINIDDFFPETKDSSSQTYKDLISLIENSSEIELKIFYDIIKPLKQNLKSVFD